MSDLSCQEIDYVIIFEGILIGRVLPKSHARFESFPRLNHRQYDTHYLHLLCGNRLADSCLWDSDQVCPDDKELVTSRHYHKLLHHGTESACTTASFTSRNPAANLQVSELPGLLLRF